MAITSMTSEIIGDVTRVFVASDLTDPVFFIWYLDGAYVATTLVGHRDFPNSSGDRVDVLDTTDADFDPIANAPVEYPARRSLWWVRSADVDVAYYLVEQKQGVGAYATVARVGQTVEAWALGWRTDRLDDLTAYTWRITPYDAAGNAGTATVVGPETIVRRPDAPSFAVSFDAGTLTVTVSAA